MVSILPSLHPCLIFLFSHFIFLAALYWIFLLYLLRLPSFPFISCCHRTTNYITIIYLRFILSYSKRGPNIIKLCLIVIPWLKKNQMHVSDIFWFKHFPNVSTKILGYTETNYLASWIGVPTFLS